MYRNQQSQIINSRGFTLIELLVVLGIFSVLLLLLPPINVESIEKIQDEQFIETFKIDVLYVQNLSTLHTGDSVSIRFYEDNYKILQGSKKPLAVRKYPPGLKINPKSYGDIQFNLNGTLVQPRTITITGRHAVYDIIFQIGKGRFYIAKR